MTTNREKSDDDAADPQRLLAPWLRHAFRCGRAHGGVRDCDCGLDATLRRLQARSEPRDRLALDSSYVPVVDDIFKGGES